MKNNKKLRASLRLAVGIGAPLVALIGVLLIIIMKSTPPCIFYELTGLYCVGCGSGRATAALLHGEIYAAFRLNPLMIILLPFVGYYLLKEYISFVFGRDVIPFPKIRSRWVGIILLIIIVAFWVLRNIRIFPFSLLAPTVI